MRRRPVRAALSSVRSGGRSTTRRPRSSPAAPWSSSSEELLPERGGRCPAPSSCSRSCARRASHTGSRPRAAGQQGRQVIAALAVSGLETTVVERGDVEARKTGAGPLRRVRAAARGSARGLLRPDRRRRVGPAGRARAEDACHPACSQAATARTRLIERPAPSASTATPRSSTARSTSSAWFLGEATTATEANMAIGWRKWDHP